MSWMALIREIALTACALLMLHSFASVSSQASTSKPSVESQCVTSLGQLGKCSRYHACKTRRWMHRGSPDFCANDNGVATICCPTELNPRRSKNVPVCGLSFASNSRPKRQVLLDGEGDDGNSTGDPEGFIVGGRDAVLGQYPWMAILFSDQDVERRLPMCGATLISLDAVLTAAHCVHQKDFKFLMRFGEHTLSNKNDGAQPFEVRVKRVEIHPGYIPPALYNDIAILRLERRVPLTSKVLPICLPQTDDNETFVAETAIAAGWGSIETSGPGADTLQEVDLPIVSNDQCNAAYANLTVEPIPSLPRGITPDIMCAGNAKEVKDSCQGDSGGPLMIFETSISRWIQVGIVSAGYYCDGGFPGIYTRITEYVDWIQKTIAL